MNTETSGRKMSPITVSMLIVVAAFGFANVIDNLAQHDRIDRIEVRWLGGSVDVFEHVEADQLLTITEGSGKSSTRRSAPK